LNFRYLGNWRQQWAMGKLVSRDRLNIGGRYTVRGYSGDMTLAADNGFVFRNELGLALGQSGQELYAGLDFGRVWGPFDEYLLGQSLSGVTLGLRGYFKGFNYDVFASRPVNRPEMFPGDRMVMGFNVGWQF
jgi:hemolysin activation/secretion protein